MMEQLERIARLNNAFCNAVVAVQDNYTFDAHEQSDMIRQLATAITVEELYSRLETFDIRGYDLDTPNVGCSPHARKKAA